VQISDYLEQLAINHMLRGVAHTPTAQVFLALFSDATTDAGGGTEATGGSYARKAITLAAPVAGASSNSSALTFTNMPAGTWTHAAIMDAVSGGNMLFHGPLAASKTTIAGQTTEVAVGELDVGFTAGSNATDYLRGKIIDRFLRNQAWTPPTVYLALFTTATDRTGGGTEASGGSYARAELDLVAPAGGVTSNADQLDFTNMQTAGADVTDAAVFDALTVGNMLLWGALNTTLEPDPGDTIRWDIGDLTLTVR
jgi:hypothetical protein